MRSCFLDVVYPELFLLYLKKIIKFNINKEMRTLDVGYSENENSESDNYIEKNIHFLKCSLG